MRKWRIGITTALITVMVGCGGSSDGGDDGAISAPPIDSCSVTAQNQFVIDLMRDIYFWLDELPVSISAADFDSPEATMAAMTFDSLDRFSGIRDQAANDAFFSESQFIGVGITLSFEDDDRVLIAQAFSDGPAAGAGIQRGYEILQINGRDVSDIIAAGDSVGGAFGENEIGVNVDLRYRDLTGSIADVSFAKDLVTIETVTVASVLDVNGQATGYLKFRNFVQPSFEALTDAFALFEQEGVTQLILDVRYNGGGLVSVAEFLSNLIGGTTTDGQILAKRVHNRLNVGRDLESTFVDETDALDLNELVVITTGSSASASELVINALNPFLDVKLVGERSFGKPVGSYGFDFCDKTAVPIAFINFNANDFGDYFDGFPVDCAASDDLTQPLGSEQEAMLAEAITVMATGQCSAAAGSTKQQQQVFEQKHRAQRSLMSEFDQLTQAF